MSVSKNYRAYVLEQLQDLGPVVAKAMFGGIGLYHDGIFFGLIDDDTVYLKVDDSSRIQFEAAGSEPFRPYGEGSYSMQYYELPAHVLEDRALLCDWAHKAVAAGRKGIAARRKRPRLL